jgi:helix-turn-helix protein
MARNIMDEGVLRKRARTLAATLEPVIGQVFFSPECHAAYEKLGFAPSPATFGNGVAAPDGPAYFTSRGSLLGQVEPEVVASAFGVFKPAVVVPGVRFGWTRTDAPTIFAARRAGAVAQLERVCGPASTDVTRVSEFLERAVEPLAEPGRPLFSGLRAQWDDPADAWTRLFHLGDMLREYRGDAHVCVWTAAGVDAIEIGLLTELYMGLPLRTYIRTRGWDDTELDGAQSRLTERGWIDDGALTEIGRHEREDMERATDRAMTSAITALDDDIDDVIATLRPWGEQMRAAGGYIGGPVDLWPNRD